MSHQAGGFPGAYSGGLLLDRTGSHDLAWRFGVALGASAGLIQIAATALPPRIATT